MKVNFIQIITIITVLGTTMAELSPFLRQLESVTSDCASDCCRTLQSRPPMTYTYYQKSGRFMGGSG